VGNLGTIVLSHLESPFRADWEVLSDVVLFCVEKQRSLAYFDLFWCVYHVAAGCKALQEQQQASLQAVREEKERMQALLQALPDG